jgi:GNAT superfamily N-acetyltransferase
MEVRNRSLNEHHNTSIVELLTNGYGYEDPGKNWEWDVVAGLCGDRIIVVAKDDRIVGCAALWVCDRDVCVSKLLWERVSLERCPSLGPHAVAMRDALAQLKCWDSRFVWLELICVTNTLVIEEARDVVDRILAHAGSLAPNVYLAALHDDTRLIQILKQRRYAKLLSWSTNGIRLKLFGASDKVEFKYDETPPPRVPRQLPLTVDSQSSPHVAVRWATPDDALFVASMVYAAFEGHLKQGLFAAPYPSLSVKERIDLIRIALVNEDALFLDARCAFELPNFLVATVDGVRAGSLVPFGDLEYSQDETWEIWEKRIHAASEKRWGARVAAYAHDVDVACGRAFDFMKGISPAMHTELIGVDEPFRGQGILKCLMERAFVLGRDLGYTEAALSCMTENSRAVTAYKKLGFVSTVQYASPALLSYVSLRKGFSFMKKTL